MRRAVCFFLVLFCFGKAVASDCGSIPKAELQELVSFNISDIARRAPRDYPGYTAPVFDRGEPVFLSKLKEPLWMVEFSVPLDGFGWIMLATIECDKHLEFSMLKKVDNKSSH